jgi:hypothetical protein
MSQRRKVSVTELQLLLVLLVCISAACFHAWAGICSVWHCMLCTLRVLVVWVACDVAAWLYFASLLLSLLLRGLLLCSDWPNASALVCIPYDTTYCAAACAENSAQLYASTVVGSHTTAADYETQTAALFLLRTWMELCGLGGVVLRSYRAVEF